MATTHTTAVRNGLADYVVDLCDAGAAAGWLRFRLSGTAAAPGTAAASLRLSDPAFGAAVGGTATAAAITSDTNAAGNASPVANATIEDDSGNIAAHCAVAASSSDINMSGGLTIGAGDTVSCSVLSYSAPA